MRNIQPIVFSGSSNPALATSIAKHLEVKLGKIQINKFSNQELRIRIQDKVANKPILVIQSLNFPTENHFFELSLIVDAVKRESPEYVIGVIPWLAYSLQDRLFKKGEPVAAEVISKFIDSLELDLVVLIDVHSRKVQSYFKTSNIHIPLAEIFINETKRIQSKNLIIIAPDEGASQRARELSNLLGFGVLQMNKVRDIETGKIKFSSFEQDIDGKDCLMCDDVVITGGTLIDAAKILRENGAKSVTVFCTHAILANNSLEKIEKSQIDKLVVSDTIYHPKTKTSKKLKKISVAPLIASKLKDYLHSK